MEVIRMASRILPPKPERPDLTVEQKRQCIDRLNNCIKELEAFDPQTVQKRFAPEVIALQNGIDKALSAAFGYATTEYNRYSNAAQLDHGLPILHVEFRGGGQHDDTHRARQFLAEGKKQSIVLLRQAVRGLEEEIRDRAELAPAPVPEPTPADEPVASCEKTETASPAPLKAPPIGETNSPPQTKEILTVKPTFMGMTIDLKELWRRFVTWWNAKR
jgi:hypothetical protein